MATVKGVWVFNDTVDIDSMPFSTHVNFNSYASNEYGEFTTLYGFSCISTRHTVNYLFDLDGGLYQTTVYEETTGWNDVRSKVVDFGSTEQEVSDEFYAWFTANATRQADEPEEEVGNIQINIAENGTTTLATAGKYCDRDIDVVVTVDTETPYNEGVEQGKQAEYDAFWDAFQSNGSLSSYRSAFNGYGWGDVTFAPKYDIVPTEAVLMFYYTRITDLKQLLLNCGAILDLSNAKNCTQVFTFNSRLKTLPKIDISSATKTAQLFYNNAKLESIDELVVNENTPFDRCFNDSPSIVHLIVTGTIGQNGFNVQWATKLDKESLLSIINCLKDYSADTSGTVWEVTIGAENLAKLTDAEKEIAKNKGWVIG